MPSSEQDQRSVRTAEDEIKRKAEVSDDNTKAWSIDLEKGETRSSSEGKTEKEVDEDVLSLRYDPHTPWPRLTR